MNKQSLGNCGKCGNKITDKNLGWDLEENGGFICEKCYKKLCCKLIKDLQNFVKSDSFNKRQKLISKVLWVSEKMGYWHDNADKSSMENVADYNGWSIRKLKLEILSELESLMQGVGLNLNKIKELHKKIAEEN